MKIKFQGYTHKGDKGHTSLYSGEKVEKDSLEIETLGTIEELLVVIGLVTSHSDDDGKLWKSMMNVQRTLFVIHAIISGIPLTFPVKYMERMQEKVSFLEEKVYKVDNPIYPGTTKGNARLFHCWAVTRRLERRLVALNREREVSEDILEYINTHEFVLGFTH